MAGRGRVGRGLRPRARAGSVVVPFRPRGPGDRLDLVRLVPAGRTLLVAFGLVAGALASYWLARETPVFAVQQIEVAGAPPHVVRQVEHALADRTGISLLKLDAAEAVAAVERLSTVRVATLDRAFPHTLRVVVSPERPVAVVRQGARSWLVSARGRVMSSLAHGARRGLPRIWIKRSVHVVTGAVVTGELRTAVAAAAPLASAHLPARVATVRTSGAALTLELRSGLEVRLGEPSGVALKLAIAARVLPLLAPGTAYLDVSVPERPVAGLDLNSQVEVETSTSTST